MLDPDVFSPVRYRYALAARRIGVRSPQILDVGGYRSRRVHLAGAFDELEYCAANVGTAWYGDEEFDVPISGTDIDAADGSHEFVISVDTLEHLPLKSRGDLVKDMLRVARRRVVVVVPFQDDAHSFEAELLECSKRWGITPMPSLVEHLRHVLPSLTWLRALASSHAGRIEYATPKFLYWNFQMAMLINTRVTSGGARVWNRKLQAYMEDEFIALPDPIDVGSAYRAVLIFDKGPTS